MVSQTPGALGYVELVYALQNKIAYGAVQNSSGNFVRASVDAVTAAAQAAVSAMPADFRVSITNPPGHNAYPIASFTWLLLYENPADKKQSRSHGGVHEVGTHRRTEVRQCPWLCSTPSSAR